MAISKQRKYVEIKDNDYINCENISRISPVYISLCTHTHIIHLSANTVSVKIRVSKKI